NVRSPCWMTRGHWSSSADPVSASCARRTRDPIVTTRASAATQAHGESKRRMRPPPCASYHRRGSRLRFPSSGAHPDASPAYFPHRQTPLLALLGTGRSHVSELHPEPRPKEHHEGTRAGSLREELRPLLRLRALQVEDEGPAELRSRRHREEVTVARAGAR